MDPTEVRASQPPVTRAAGVRIDYPALPASVRRWVDHELGSDVASAVTQTGGFSPGAAARLVARNGRRAFVKAVGTSLNPDTPGLIRRERAAMEAMPALPWTPTLRSAYDDGDWVALLFDDVEGREPGHPWTREDTDLVFAALADLTAAITPSPWPEAPKVQDHNLFRGIGGWECLLREPPADLDPWALERLEVLVEHQRRARTVVDGTSLVHLDIRADNILLTGDGGVIFVDWAWASVGAAWADTVLASLDLVISGSDVDADELLARHRSTSHVEPDDITTLIAALAGALSERSRDPAPPGLPTIRAYQRMVSEALLRWLRRRMN